MADIKSREEVNGTQCLFLEKVADDFITRRGITEGNYDVLEGVNYEVLDYWDVGEIFERLIEDVTGDRDSYATSMIKGANK